MSYQNEFFRKRWHALNPLRICSFTGDLSKDDQKDSTGGSTTRGQCYQRERKLRSINSLHTTVTNQKSPPYNHRMFSQILKPAIAFKSYKYCFDLHLVTKSTLLTIFSIMRLFIETALTHIKCTIVSEALPYRFFIGWIWDFKSPTMFVFI